MAVLLGYVVIIEAGTLHREKREEREDREEHIMTIYTIQTRSPASNWRTIHTGVSDAAELLADIYNNYGKEDTLHADDIYAAADGTLYVGLHDGEGDEMGDYIEYRAVVEA
jgi:hypothetical protein